MITITIEGEKGSGKSTIARFIHIEYPKFCKKNMMVPPKSLVEDNYYHTKSFIKEQNPNILIIVK